MVSVNNFHNRYHHFYFNTNNRHNHWSNHSNTVVNTDDNNVFFASVSQELSEEEKESGFYDEDGTPKLDRDRPAINPEFDPDEDCNISYELKCIPGSKQSCFDLEGFNNGENNVCTPIECQEGYYGVDEDETGLCYPNSEECPSYDEGMVLVERGAGYGLRCAYLHDTCDDEEHSSKDYCIEYCEENSDAFACKPE